MICSRCQLHTDSEQLERNAGTCDPCVEAILASSRKEVEPVKASESDMDYIKAVGDLFGSSSWYYDVQTNTFVAFTNGVVHRWLVLPSGELYDVTSMADQGLKQP